MGAAILVQGLADELPSAGVFRVAVRFSQHLPLERQAGPPKCIDMPCKHHTVQQRSPSTCETGHQDMSSLSFNCISSISWRDACRDRAVHTSRTKWAILEADWAYAAPVKPQVDTSRAFKAMLTANMETVTTAGAHIRCWACSACASWPRHSSLYVTAASEDGYTGAGPGWARSSARVLAPITGNV